MAPGAAALKAAAVVAVFAVLVLSSLGQPAAPILCRDCASQCSSTSTCSSFVATECSSYCNPSSQCQDCKSTVFRKCSASCNNGCGATSGTCISACNNDVASSCRSTCYISPRACQDCQSGAGQQCAAACNRDCSARCSSG